MDLFNDYLRAFLWWTLPVVVGVDERCSVDDRSRLGSDGRIIVDGVKYWTAEADDSLNVFPRWGGGSCKLIFLSEFVPGRIWDGPKSEDFFAWCLARVVLRVWSLISFEPLLSFIFLPSDV